MNATLTMTEKRCSRCGQIKSLEEFSRNRNLPLGRNSWCRKCFAAHSRSPKGRISQARRSRKYQRSEKGRVSGRRSDRKYRQQAEHREKRAQIFTKYNASHVKENRAKGKVRYAIAKGLLIRPNVCSNCGRKGRINAHHEDYDKPLQVDWLCETCHRLLHAQRRMA